MNDKDDYDLEIKWRYTYSDGISVIASSKNEADIKHNQIIRDLCKFRTTKGESR